MSAHVLQQNGGSAFWTGGKDHDGNHIMTWTGKREWYRTFVLFSCDNRFVEEIDLYPIPFDQVARRIFN